MTETDTIVRYNSDGQPADLLSALLVQHCRGDAELAERNAHLWQIDRTDRYLMVEKFARDNTPFLTSHATAEDAAAYHVGQDFVEDWQVVELVDLHTGVRFDPAFTVTWQPKPQQVPGSEPYPLNGAGL